MSAFHTNRKPAESRLLDAIRKEKGDKVARARLQQVKRRLAFVALLALMMLLLAMIANLSLAKLARQREICMR